LLNLDLVGFQRFCAERCLKVLRFLA
jgi:hypothetical protein